MPNIVDFETFSPVDIDAGSVKYAQQPTADIVCLAVRPMERYGIAKSWVPGQPPPVIKEDDILYAHNALFDFCIWHFIGVPRYRFPEVPLERWCDSMALCTRYGLPGKLADAGAVLGAEVQKDRRGAALIKKICLPTISGQRPQLGLHYTMEELRALIEYCKQDTDSLFHIVDLLPSHKLAEREQKIWVLTQKMNLKGLPVDSTAIFAIDSYIQMYAKELSLQVPELTNGAVNKVTQVKKLVEFINNLGYPMDNLQASTVEYALDDPDLPSLAATLLELRQILGKSSSAKFAKLVLMEWFGRIYNNLQYYRAGTGRWGGRGFQPQNLPRLQLKDALKVKDKLSLHELLELMEEVIQKFIDCEPVDGALNIAKSLIRAMVKASPGKMLIVKDYSSIENRLLHWYAFDEETLEKFRQHDYDQYIDMAAFLFALEESQVGKKSYERQVGKVIILGCGFIMGADRFLEECKKYKIDMDRAGAQRAVTAYREKYPKVVKMWRKLYKAACNAIVQPGTTFSCHRCDFKVVRDKHKRRWLVITLASGRALYYMDPYIVPGQFGPSIRHMGQHPKTHQWTDVPLSVTRVVENIVQGTARDIMAEGLLNIDEELPEVDLICTVHDEGIGECDEDRADELADKFEYLMCRMPEWAEGLPLHAAGYVAQRYRKD